MACKERSVSASKRGGKEPLHEGSSSVLHIQLLLIDTIKNTLNLHLRLTFVNKLTFHLPFQIPLPEDGLIAL